MGKRILCLLLTAALIFLCGCGNQEKDAPVPAEALPTQAPTAAPMGPAAQAVERLLAPYRSEIARVSAQAGEGAACVIPSQVLSQFAADAQAADAAPEDGHWAFSLQEAGDHTYESSAMELYESDPTLLSATPDPGNEAPQDHQLMGDYDVTGGGRFVRVRAYDAAESLTEGKAEFTDTLNGETTGRELFSFAVRDGKMYFVDAAMILTAGLDGLEDRGMYLVAAGYVGENALDVIEYETQGAENLPDPRTLELSNLLANVMPLSRISDQNGRISLSP